MVEMAPSTCEVCGSSQSSVLFVGRDRLLGLPGSFPVVECRRCGLVYTNPRPVKIGDYYPEQYGVYDPSGGQAVRLALYHRRTARHLHRLCRPVHPGNRAVLDVGCGEGAFLSEMSALGWNCTGLEMNARAAERARGRRGLDVLVGTVEEAVFEPGIFDLVTLSHVIEHVEHPRQTLNRLKGWIRPGGLLFLALPNVACWERRIFGEDWYCWDLPRHLNHFSPSSLGQLLSEVGFGVEETRFLSGLFVPQSLRYRLKGAEHGEAGAGRGPQAHPGIDSAPDATSRAAGMRERVKTALFFLLLGMASAAGRVTAGEVMEITARAGSIP